MRASSESSVGCPASVFHTGLADISRNPAGYRLCNEVRRLELDHAAQGIARELTEPTALDPSQETVFAQCMCHVLDERGHSRLRWKPPWRSPRQPSLGRRFPAPGRVRLRSSTGSGSGHPRCR